MSTRTRKLMRFSAVVSVFLTLVSSASAQGGWMPFKINTGGSDLNTVYFLDSKRGWVGGDGGYLSRTDDGGQSWVRRMSARTPPSTTSIFVTKKPDFCSPETRFSSLATTATTGRKSRIFLPEEFDGADVELVQRAFFEQEERLGRRFDQQTRARGRQHPRLHRRRRRNAGGGSALRVASS